MQAIRQSLLDLLGMPDIRLVIPVYQRVYSWNEQQCESLWHDIMRAGTLASDHFVGTVLYCVEAEDERQLDIIDGQQRLATLSIVLSALSDYLESSKSLINGLSADNIVKTYALVASAEKKIPKLTLARADRETFAAVMGAGDMPEQASQRVIENYEIFRNHMQEDDFDVAVLWSGVKHLIAIIARLEEGDSPQLIFESLNSKGMPLTTGDLVRNSLLVSVNYKDQERLYREYWEPIENALGDDPTGRKLNAAVHGWLAVRFPRAHIHDASEVYDVFKSYVIDVYDGPLEGLLKELRDFCVMFGKATKADPDRAFTMTEQMQNKKHLHESFGDLKMPEAPLKRDLGSSRRTYE